MPTIRSIAEDLNLSAATVSRALRGTGGVNADTLERVRLAAQRLGYAKTRANMETQKTIALVVPSKSAADMHELARRYVIVINEEFAKRGWQLHPIFVQCTDVDSAEGLPLLVNGLDKALAKLSGCLVAGRLPEEFCKTLAERFSNNVVMICRHDVLNGISGVTQMNYAGGVRAAKILLDAGHRRFGWIGALGSKDSAKERLGGVLATLLDNNASLVSHLRLNERVVIPASKVAQSIAEVLPARKADWPTAWICSNDWLAAKLIVWARSQNIEIPREMSIVAFDNTRVAEELAEITITSVVFPYEQIARKSVELLEILLNAPVADSIVWSLPPRLRVGGTLGPAACMK